MLAFIDSVDKHGRSFWKYFHRKTGDAHRADDLLQQFWRGVYKTFRTSQFSQVKLLQRKAQQTFVDDLRVRGVRSFLDFTDKVPDVADTVSHEPETPEEESRLKSWFWDRFPSAKLTENQKDVFWLYAHYGYTGQEIAARLSIPNSTVHEWIHKVREECAAAANSED